MPNKILAINVSMPTIKLLKRLFSENGIIISSDSSDAMNKLDADSDIYVIVVELNADKKDSFRLVKLLHGKYENIRIIVLSDSNSPVDEVAAFENGAHDYVLSPTNQQVLEYRIAKQQEIIEKQKLTENKIMNYDFTFEAILQQAPVGIVISHNINRFGGSSEDHVYVNKKFEQICGRTKADLIEIGWANITHPDDLQKDLMKFKELQAGKIDSYSMDKRYIKPDGSIVWVHMVVAALNLNNDKFNHICMVKDITEQKEIIKQLKESKKLFRTFIDSNHDLIYLKNDQFQHIISNKALAEFYGVSVDELVGKTDYDVLGAEAADNCRKSDQETITKNCVINTIEKIGDFIFETSKFPVVYGDGKTGVGAHIRNITEEYKQREIINKFSETNRIIAECMLKTFPNKQEQLDYALHEAIQLTESKYGYIFFYDENNHEFTLNSWSIGVIDDCSVAEQKVKYQLDETGIWGEVVRRRKPIVINCFQATNPLKKGYPEGHVDIHKYMSIPIFENGIIVAVIGFANKISDYTDNDVFATAALMNGVWIATKKIEKEKETEYLLEQTRSMINDHEAVMLLVEPTSGKILDANKSAVEFFGYSQDELLKLTTNDLNMISPAEARNNRLLAFNRSQKYFTIPYQLRSGEIRIVDIYSSPIEYFGEEVLFCIVFDVTKREEITKLNEYLAYHDGLTCTYNRRFFDEELMRRNKDDSQYPIALIMGDIDGLKIFNDTFGHLEGDKALIDVANRISRSIGENDILARIGGDEFAVIVSEMNERKIREYLDKLDQQVNNPDNIDADRHVSISFGYGIQRKKEDTADHLLKEAEAFMYNRKYYNIKSARSNTVNVIMDTLFAKSEREKIHSERVGIISETIARKMNLDHALVNQIRVAGFLHDIGKIGIDESILNKTGKLTKNEWDIMKLHSVKGAGILENTIEFRQIANFVLSHHERYDGSGYPNGLKGEKIPLASRIIAIADAYDAMTHDRSYRKKMSSTEAINELKSCSGTLFDPDIVSVFVNEAISDTSTIL